ncbi:MAG: iron-containing alcohol dehydrogenase, partial [Frisingicoccus sp.]|uniref:iron-containing alcohol dehydrogenase n=1 Tax=Frisingicoccus sp. TaxID=1918627 RepID=UPI00262FD6CB
MKEFSIIPKIVQMDSAEEFCRTYQVGKGDLFFVSGHMYERFFKGNTEGACVVNYRNYASGEPTDLMVEGIYKDIQDIEYDRVIAVGGGTILDVAKLFALKYV